MAKLEAYDKTLDYSYAPGIFPATECLKNAKKRCMRLLVSSNGLQSEGVQALEKAAQEAADKAARSEARRQITLILRNGGTVPNDLWEQSGYSAVTIAAMLRGRKG